MHGTTSADPAAEEDASQLRKRILKLRWMGMEREADELAHSPRYADILGRARPTWLIERE
jgi:hypothetical protein